METTNKTSINQEVIDGDNFIMINEETEYNNEDIEDYKDLKEKEDNPESKEIVSNRDFVVSFFGLRLGNVKLKTRGEILKRGSILIRFFNKEDTILMYKLCDMLYNKYVNAKKETTLSEYKLYNETDPLIWEYIRDTYKDNIDSYYKAMFESLTM